MPNESSVPGLWNGMFFEHYIFAPRSNFREEDVVHVASLIDIEFEHDEFPHKEHFEDNSFAPKEGLTVSQFADILQAMKITAPADMIERLPEDLQEQFNEDGIFEPFDDFGLDDLVQFLTQFVVLKIAAERFNDLPRHVQRQFLVQTRDGKSWRYGDRRPG